MYRPRRFCLFCQTTKITSPNTNTCIACGSQVLFNVGAIFGYVDYQLEERRAHSAVAATDAVVTVFTRSGLDRYCCAVRSKHGCDVVNQESLTSAVRKCENIPQYHFNTIYYLKFRCSFPVLSGTVLERFWNGSGAVGSVGSTCFLYCMETLVPCQLLLYSSAWAGSFLTGPSLTLSSREVIPPKPPQLHKGGWLCCYTVPSKRSSGARHKESFPFSAARKPHWCIPQSSLSESEMPDRLY